MSQPGRNKLSAARTLGAPRPHRPDAKRLERPGVRRLSRRRSRRRPLMLIAVLALKGVMVAARP